MRNYTDKDIEEAVSSSTNYKEAIEKLGIRAAGGNYKTIQENIKRLGISTKHFIIINKSTQKIPLEKVLVENSTYKRDQLKKRLIQEEIIEYECQECGLSDKWNNKKIVLQIDHKNGIWNDNRIKNLRFLCPNCHSQTKNFAGKNNSKGTVKYYKDLKYTGKCKDCGQKLKSQSKRCMDCSNKKQQKIKWPSVNKLIEMLSESNFYALGKKLGVSDNAIRKHLKSNGVDYKTLRKK